MSCCFAEGREDSRDSTRSNALAFAPSGSNHCVSLPRSSLAVGDDSTVVAFDHSIQNRPDRKVVDVLL